MIRYKRLAVVALAVFVTSGIAVATADAPTITGFPNQIRKVDLAGDQAHHELPVGSQHRAHLRTDVPVGREGERARADA